MRPKKPETTREDDLFRARLDQIINLKHELVQLAGKIDWTDRQRDRAALQRQGAARNRKPLRDRAAVAQAHFGLSDEGVCERWVYDPYFQYFTGEEFFQHTFPHERSDLSHWRAARRQARAAAGREPAGGT